MNTVRSRTTAAVALLAAAGFLAFSFIPPTQVAMAYPPAGSPEANQPAEQPQLPPGHPPLEQQLPAGHPPVPGQLPSGHPPVQGQRPPGHPTLNDAAPPKLPPPADPEDVASIDRIVNAYYASISAPAGEGRNWDRFRSLFIPEGRLIASQTGQAGMPAAVLSPEQFVRLNAAYFEQGGYVEHDIFRRIETFGNTAHIFSTYETRRAAEDAEPYSRGINSIQLVNDGTRWWIATVMWDYERPDNPIPAHYLPSAPASQAQNP